MLGGKGLSLCVSPPMTGGKAGGIGEGAGEICVGIWEVGRKIGLRERERVLGHVMGEKKSGEELELGGGGNGWG